MSGDELLQKNINKTSNYQLGILILFGRPSKNHLGQIIAAVHLLFRKLTFMKKIGLHQTGLIVVSS